jgi:hypothetical protein
MSDAVRESIFMDSSPTGRPSERRSMVRINAQKCNSKEYLDAGDWKKCQLLD